MKSLYRRSWFPGIGRKPLESIRIGCEPSPAQSRLFFASYFICVREPDLVFAHWSWAQTNRQKSKQTAIKKTKTISDFFVIPESMSRYRRSTSQYRRSTSQHGRSTSCPGVVLGSLCFQHAIFFSCWNSLNVSDILAQTPERMPVSKKNLHRFFFCWAFVDNPKGS